MKLVPEHIINDMDQVVFIFDLEQVLPLEQVFEERLMEERLLAVKQAVLRILESCSNAFKIDENKRDLPSFGFR